MIDKSPNNNHRQTTSHDNKVIDDKTKEKIKPLAEKYGLSLVVLFGSEATGRTHPKSDIDIAVLSNNKFDSNIIDDFYDIFKREDVEVVDMGDMDSDSPLMMRSLVDEGKLLYEDISGEFFRWKLYAISVWRDAVQWQYRILENIARMDISN